MNEANNTTYKVGDTYTTIKSGVKGTIMEIIPNANGSLRIRLDVNGKDRWTTVKEGK